MPATDGGPDFGRRMDALCLHRSLYASPPAKDGGPEFGWRMDALRFNTGCWTLGR